MMAPMHPMPFGPPQHYAFPQGNQNPRPFSGTCYICQQTGHMAKICPFSYGQPPRGQNNKREDQKDMEKGDSLLQAP